MIIAIAKVIAIDGPSASGKGTLARRLAAHFGLAYLDSGSLYRGVALMLTNNGDDPNNTEAAKNAANNFDLNILADPRLRHEETGEAASLVAAMPGVRAGLLAFQRQFAENPPAGARGAVIDGRDIGTVVCPGASFKFFVIASDEVRARRRTQELKDIGQDADYDKILQTIKERDKRDSTREISPLRAAEDAHLLDTTNLDIDGAFEKACVILKEAGLF